MGVIRLHSIAMPEFTNEEEEEIARAFKICDANTDGKLNSSELQLYLFGLGCNLTKKQMIELSSTGGELDEAAARAAFIKYRDEELVTLDQIMNVFRTWDSTNSGTVPYSTIMAEVGDGNVMCPFDGAVKGLFD